MSTIVAIVKSLVGQVFAVSLDGLKRQVFEGERLLMGEQILTGLGGEVTLQLANGDVVDVAQNSSWQAAPSEAPADAEKAQANPDLEQALAAGFDPTTDLEATAAGPGAGGGTGGAAGGGHSFVMLTETGQQLEATVGFETSNPGLNGTAQDELFNADEQTTAANNILDTTAPNAPSVTLANDSGANATDLITNDGTLVIGGIEPGALVEYSTDGGATWSNTFTPNEGSNTVLVRQTDPTGNTSPSSSLTFTLDTQVTAPTLALTTDSGVAGDLISNDGSYTVSGTEPGALVEYSTDGTTWSTTAPVAVEGSNTIQVRQTDVAGNVSAPSSLTFTVDTAATAAPTVTITSDANNDQLLSNTELGAATTVAVTVGLPAGAVAGDTLTVTDGTTPQVIVLTQPQIDAGNVAVTVARPAEGAALTVTATVTDKAGNVSLPGSDNATVDTAATAAPTVTITSDANNDQLLSNTELGAATTVAVTVGLPAGAVAGDTLTVTDGTTPQVIVLTQPQIDAGNVAITVARPAEGAALTVTATVTDKAGNVSLPGSDNATVDTAATAAPTVTITSDANNDQLLSNTELGAATTVAVTVGLPAGAVAGDTLTVTDGTTPQVIVLTQPQIDAGNVAITVARPAEGAALTVTATVTDKAGNVSLPGSDNATVDTAATAAPTVTITSDANNDQLLSNTELGAATTVAVTVGLPAGAVAGDTLTVTDGTTPQVIVLTQPQIDAGNVAVTVARPAEGAALTVTATVTDKAGNVSLPGSDNATVDTAATAAPTVTITSDANNDQLLSNTELGAATTVAVTVGLPAGAVAGDTLTVTDGTTPQVIVLTQPQIDAGNVAVTVARPAEGAALTVTATVTDKAGNVSLPGSDNATVDTAATAAPTVTITSDANNDQLLSNTELGAATTVAVTVGLPAGAVAGDTLTVTDGTTPQVIVLTQPQIDAGNVAITVARPAEGAALTVTATVTDKAGNVSLPGSDNATVDTAATAAPTVTITSDANNDQLLSNTELGAATTVAVTVGLPAGAVAGDTLTVTDGTTPQVIVLTQPQIDAGNVAVTVARPAEGAALTVTATVTDKAGNVSLPGSDNATVDTAATAAPTVTITSDANNDQLLSNTELGAATTVAVTVGLPAGAVAGDTLTVTDGTTPQVIVLTQPQIDAGNVAITVARPAEGAALTVTATVTDKAGNVSLPGSDNATVDTAATAAPTVTITSDANNDQLLSNTELGAATTVAVTVGLPAGAVAGDTLTVTDGTTPQVIVLTQPQIDAGNVAVTVARPAEGAALTVTATVTDKAGNVSLPGSDNATVDTAATAAPTVTITSDANNDQLLSNTELGAATTVAVTVGLPAGAVAGDTLTVTDGTTPQVIVLTQPQIDAGNVAITVARPAEGAALTVTATVTDKAGNVSLPGSDNATVDTAATAAPTVTITSDANNDQLLSNTELGAATTVAVTVGLPAGAVAGDTLTVTDGTTPQVIVLTQPQIDAGNVAVTVARPAEGAALTVTATVTDKAGNVSLPGSDNATVDTAATAAPTVTITSDANNDQLLSNTELGAATTVAVTVGLPAGAVAGDTLTVTDGTTPQVIVLTQPQIDAGNVAVTVARPAEGAALTVTATVTDKAGNVSLPGSDNATVDTAATAAPTVTITSDANNDQLLSNTELGAATTVAVTVGLPAGAVAGDTLTVTDGTTPQVIVLTQPQIDAGNVAITVARPAEGAALTVTATVTDKAGNVSLPGSDNATVDTAATAAPTVTITSDANNDQLLSNTELGAATTVAVTVGLPAGAVAGDTLTVTDGTTPQVIVLTQPQIDAGNVAVTVARPAEGAALTVTATVTDKAGNVSLPGSDNATVDTAATAAPTVTITSDANNDQLLSNTELGAATTVAVTVGLPAGAVAGDTLTVTDGTTPQVIVLTQPQIDAGNVAVTVARPAEGAALTVTATVTDKAGNVSLPGSDNATVDTAATAAPTVTITSDANNDQLLSNTELGAATTVAVTVGLPAGAVAGDTLTVTDGTTPQVIVLTQPQIDAGNVAITVARPAEGAALTVTATVTDKAGNVSLPGSDNATVDTAATAAPTVTITSDANNDQLLSNTELGAATTVAVTVGLPAGAVAGDTLTVTDGTTPQVIVLTQPQIDAGNVAVTVARPAEGAALTVTATVTDKAGNVSLPGSDNATVDTAATAAPTVTITSDANNDQLLSNTELGAATTVAVTVGLPAGAVAGDTLTVTDGTTPQVIVLTQPQIDAGNVAVTVARPAEGAALTVTATVTDKAGNVSLPGSDNATVDTAATAAPTVTITSDANNDQLLSNTELGAATTVAVTVGLPAGAVAGDTLTVTDGTTPQVIVLTQPQIDAGNVAVTVARPAEGAALTVTATVTDKAGNVSLPGSDNATVDTAATAAPTVTITSDANNDQLLSNTELGAATTVAVTVGLPAGAVAGDTLTVTDGTTPQVIVLTQPQIDAGNVAITVARPAEGAALTVTATVTDKAGNVSLPGSDNATVDTAATAAPTVTITSDANNDQLLSNTELGAATTVAVTVGLPAGAVAGDTLTVTDGTTPQVIVLTQPQIDAGNVAVTVARPAEGAALTVTATVTDKAGNVSLPGSDNATVDTAATAAPTVTITSDANNDQLLSNTELGAATTVAVTVGLPAGAVAGDTLTVTDGTTPQVIVLTQPQIDAGNVAVTVARPAEGAALTVTATVTDKAGNVSLPGSDNATVDTAATAAPTVTITSDANNDQLLSNTELGAATTVAVTVGLPAGAVAGDTLTVTDGTTPQVIVLTQPQIDAGNVAITVARPAEGAALTVTATVTDKAGNVSLPGSDNATVDTAATAAPTVTITSDANNDQLLSNTELGAATTVAVTVGLPAGAVAGDTLTVTDGTTPQVIVLTQPQIDAGNVAVTVARPAEGAALTVTATVTDKAGNVSLPGSDNATVDTAATAAPTVTITSDANNDQLLSNTELGAATTVAVTVGLPAGAVAGDTLTVTDGTTPQVIVLTQPQIDAGNVAVTVARPAEGAALTVTATVTDKAGNVSLPGSDNATVDTAATAAPTVTITSDANNDQLLSNTELGAATTVAVTVGLPAGAVAGDTLTVTDGTTPQVIVLTQPQIDAGNVAVTVARPAEGAALTVTATVTDKAGNVSLPGSDNATVDTAATAAPTVTITSDANNDQLLSNTELGAATTVAVTVGLPAGAVAGDTLTVTDGTTPQVIVLTQPQIDAGNVAVTVARPAEGAALTVTATVTDKAGNVSLPGSDNATVDTAATAAPTVTITSDANNDQLLSNTELGAATTVAVTVGLPAGAVAGDTLTVTDGTTPQVIVLTQPQIDAGNVAITVARPAEGAALTVTATVTDKAGNVSLPGSDNATVDTAATAAPTVTITSDANNDQLLSNTELGAATTVAVTVGLPAGAVAGDTLTVTDGTTPQVIVLTQPQIDAGNVAITVARPAEGAALTVTATVTDKAGNVSLPGSDNATVDTAATAAPTVTITSDANNDQLLSNTELGAATTVAVTVGLPAGAVAGDTLTVTDGTTPQVIVLTQPQIDAGNVAVTVARPAEGAALTVTATVTDKAGNVSLPGSDNATVDTAATAAPTVTITSDANNDQLLSNTELGAATTVAVTVGLPAGAVAGDTLTVTDGTTPQVIVLTQPQIDAGNVAVTVARPAEGAALTVTATVTDKAGNVSLPGSDNATVDTAATAAPTVTITSDANNDQLLSNTELGAATTVAVTVGLPAGAVAGDTLTVTDGTTPQVIVLTQPQIDAGNVAITVARPAEGAALTVTATVTDKAGNVSLPGSDNATVDTAATAAPTVTITSDANNDQLLSNTELGAATTVAVTVGLPAGAVAGDTLTVTDGTTPQVIVLTQPQIDAGNVAVTVARPAEGAALTVTATVTDKAGNVSLPGSDNATVDTAATAAPTVTITSDANNDQLLSNTELGAATTVAVTVGLPAGAVAGDTLTVTDGTTPQVIVLTQPQIDAGNVAVTVARPAEGAALTVTATVTDKAGNVSLPGSDNATVDTAATAAPTVTITSDANNDQLLSNTELGAATTVAVTVGLPAGAVAGDTLTVTDGTTPQVIVLTQPQIDAGNVAITVARPAEGAALTVTATVTDKAGNVSLPGSDNATVDTAATAAPTVTITSDANNDQLLSNTELGAATTVAVTVGLPAGAVAGDTLTVTDGTTPQVIVLTQPQIDAGNVAVTVARPAEGAALTVTATVTDKAGNVSLPGSDNATVDTAATAAPTVTITSDANNDQLLSNTELGAATTVAVTVGLPAGAVAGDTLTVTDGTTPQVIVLTQPQIDAGNVAVTVARPAEGAALTVTATVTDKAGNVSLPGSDNATVDTAATAAPTVTITSDANNDQLLSNTELGAATTVAVTVGLPAGAVAGDTLTVTDGTTPQVIVLTQPQIDAGNVAVTVARPAEGAALTVTATVTDKAGNVSLPGSDNATVDTAATAAPTVTITSDANNDQLLSNTELGAATTVAVTVGLPAGAVAGDTLTVTDGTTPQVIVLTQPQIDAGNVAITVARPAEGAALTVTATVTDKAGNVSLPGSDNATVDTAATAAPTVTITSDANNDQLLSNTELGAATTVAVTVGLPAGAVAGDTLTVTDGTTPQVIVLTQPQIDAGNVAVTVARPAEGAALTVTATVTDKAGNVSLPGSDNATVDTAATAAPTVTITSDANNDQLLSNTELGAATTVAVTVGLPAGAVAGDTLTVTDGTTPQVIVLTQPQIDAGNVAVTVARPAEGAALTVTATVTDKAGNVSLPGSDNATVDTAATAAPTVTITSDANNDQLLSNTELGAATTVAVTVGLPAGAVAGDTLTVTDGTTPQVIVLTQPQIDAGNVAITVARPAEGAALTVTATVTDKAGNVSLPGSDNATVDTAATAAPTVTITSDANNDQLLSNTELGAATTVAVTVGLPAGAVAGDTLTVTDGTTPQVIVLTQPQIDAGNVAVTVARPAEGAALTVTATVTDKAGNVSLPGSDNATVDTAATAAPTVTITSDANNDQLLSNTELGAATTVAVTVGLPAGAVAGDTLTVTDGTTPQVIVLTQPQIDAGNVAVTVARPAEGAALTVTATVTDKAGNVSLPGSDNATVDTAATAAPTVTITSDANNDQLLSNTELGAATTVAVTVGLPAGAVAGDTLTVTDGTTPQVIVLTQPQIDAGNVAITVARPAEGAALTVTATVTDKAGNVSLPGSDNATVDTAATAAPTVTITSDANNDQLLSNTELGAATTVAVTVGLPAGAVAGDTLTVTDGTTPQVIVLTQPQIDAGNVAVTVARPAEGAALTVTATVTDKAGNVSLPGSDNATVDTAATAAPTVTITSDANNDQLLSNTELGAATTVAVTVGLPAGAVAGDTLTVTDGTTPQVIVLTQPQIDAGNVAITVARPAEGAALTVTATVTDKAGNVSLPGSDNATVDTAGPTVVISTTDSNLSVGEATTLTFTFSESVSGFTASDIVPTGGVISNLVQSVGNPAVWTATFTSTGGGSPSVSLPAGSYTDLVGNAGAADSLNLNSDPIASNDNYLVSGLVGQYFGYNDTATGAGNNGANLTNLAQVETFINGRAPTATFTATSLNYGPIGNGGLGNGTNLQTFLGGDASSLSSDPASTSDAILRLNGLINLTAGNYQFRVTADDGFSIRINGQTVAEYNGNQGPTARESLVFTVPEGGAQQFEIVYWDQDGNAQLTVELRPQGGSYSVVGGSSLQHENPALVTNEDQPLTISPATLLGNDTDPDGNPLSIMSVQGATHGSVALVGGNVVFTPDANYNGAATFTYTVSDGLGGLSTATVTLGIKPVNDAPVAVADSAITNEGSPVTINVLANDTDVDGDILMVTGATASNGTVVVNTNNTLTFTPASGFSGTAIINYSINDGNGGTATAQAFVEVQPVANGINLQVNTSSTIVVSTSFETVTAGNLNTNILEGWSHASVVDPTNGGTRQFEVWRSGESMSTESGSITANAGTGNGTNFLELNVVPNGSTLPETLGLQRSISTVAGDLYTLSLDYAGRSSYGVNTTRIHVEVDGVRIGTFADISSNTSLTWQTLQFSFVGTGGNQSVRIITDQITNTPGRFTGGRGTFIDDIVIERSKGAIAGNAQSGAKTNISLNGLITTTLIDNDSSEQGFITLHGLPDGALFFSQANPAGIAASNGSVTFNINQLSTASLQLDSSYKGHINLSVEAFSVETSNGNQSSSSTAELQLVIASPNNINNQLSATDTIVGSSANDTLLGSSRADLLIGGDGNDVIFGNAGNDTIVGGRGNDTLWGGSGADTFVWKAGDLNSAGGNDVIKDFTMTGTSRDTIDLHDLLQGENDGNILNYLRVDTATSTLLISSTGVLNASGSNADVTIKLENGSGGNLNINPGNLSQADLVNSLIAGADPLIKIDHN
ncbi:Ig-like domain-containing protein [Pseudomonas sp. MAC6]|uniref:Ig-like domain-containing protein n=1 Tax=Pseudomonas sp. MAC6 TaxID=3401633 RepID=UPI003BF489D4